MKYWQVLILMIIHLSITTAQNANTDRLELSNPRDAIWTHLYYLQPDHYNPELASLPFQVIEDSLQRIESAILLKQILDGKGLYVYVNKIPSSTNYIDSLNKSATYTLFPELLPEIFLSKTGEQWLFDEESLDLLGQLHRETYPFGTSALLKYFDNTRGGKFFGLSLWQVFGMMILLVGAIFVFYLLGWLFRMFVTRVFGRRFKLLEAFKGYAFKISRYASLFFTFVFLKVFFPVIQLSPVWSKYILLTLNICLAIFILLLILRIIDLITASLKIAAESTENKMDDQLLPIFKQGLKIIVTIIAIFHIMHLLDVNITAIIAGISIGGLAMALAAQDTVKNLFGSAIIFIDRPFQIGDWIILDGYEGAVVQVGFRSTRIQKVDTSIVAVPNGHIANSSITNLGVRHQRLLNVKLGILYSSSPEQIQNFIDALKEMLIDHPEVNNENFLVNLLEMGDSSINILFRAYLFTDTYKDELRIKEELYFQVLKIAKRVGVDFAFPSRSLYIEKS